MVSVCTFNADSLDLKLLVILEDNDRHISVIIHKFIYKVCCVRGLTPLHKP